MRCKDVRKAIATPVEPTLPASARDHIAACPDCASWAEAAARLDRVWAATRPDEPPSEVFDAVWATALARVESPRTLPLTAARSRRNVWIAAGLVQAAALLVAVYFSQGPGRVELPQGPGPLPVALNSAPITVGDDETVVIRIDSSRVEVTRLDSGSEATLVAFNDDIPTVNDNEALNAFESMSE